MRSPASVRRCPTGTLCPSPFPFPRLAIGLRPSEPHAVGVAVLVVALVAVAVAGGHAGLAHDDHARRASVDAEPAPRADVLVDDEDDLLVGVLSRLARVDRVGHGLRREHPDALPRAAVDAALAHDALGL